MLYGKVLITGGSGYLGRAIMKRAQRESWPCQFTVFSRDEYKQAKCRRQYKDARYILGDVRYREQLTLAMVGHDLTIHTAALKYVPEGEHNVTECISVNVGGTQSVFAAAREADMARVVVISTDKAVAPSNVYGMTKALCERLVGETAMDLYGPEISAVRYGNVIGSTGSVIPEFERQYKETKHVSVTDPDMTRFWMPVDDAIDLIVTASKSESGSILVPQPRAMLLADLVAAVVPNATMDVTGLRPGEKMHETLLTQSESVFATTFDNEAIYRIPAISRRSAAHRRWFEITSDNVDCISADEFRAEVEYSHSV